MRFVKGCGAILKTEAQQNHTLNGGKPISRLSVRLIATVGLPLVLGGCGLPIGIQIASLLADGVSFITTEKTLTDHGISIVAKKDCAIWRGLKGDDICRNADLDALNVAAIDEPLPVASEPRDPAYFESEPGEFIAADFSEVQVAAEEPDVVETLASPIQVAVIEPDPVMVPPVDVIPPIPPVPPVVEVAPEPVIDAPTVERQGGTFLIIASYHRSSDAQRFARAQSTFDTTVLAGRAKGRSVYRVAIGPVDRAEHADVRTGLVNAGFADVWTLRQSKPEIIIQLAAID